MITVGIAFLLPFVTIVPTKLCTKQNTTLLTYDAIDFYICCRRFPLPNDLAAKLVLSTNELTVHCFQVGRDAWLSARQYNSLHNSKIRPMTLLTAGQCLHNDLLQYKTN